jgi:hypothetical protein
MKACDNVKDMRLLSILRLKPDAGAGLMRMCFEEMQMRGLIPQLANYEVQSIHGLHKAEINAIMSGQHEWIQNRKTIQVSDILRIDGITGPRYFYRDTNGYVSLEYMIEVYEIKLRDNEMLIFVVPPAGKSYPSTVESSMDAMQAIVGGTADVDYFTEKSIIVTNKDAQSLDVPANRIIDGKSIVGTFFICGLDKDEKPCSLNEEQIAGLIKKFNST